MKTAATGQTEFEIKLAERVAATIREQRKAGMEGMSLDCFLQTMRTDGLAYLKGSPRGTNAQWTFREFVRDTIGSNRAFREFVRLR